MLDYSNLKLKLTQQMWDKVLKSPICVATIYSCTFQKWGKRMPEKNAKLVPLCTVEQPKNFSRKTPGQSQEKAFWKQRPAMRPHSTSLAHSPVPHRGPNKYMCRYKLADIIIMAWKLLRVNARGSSVKCTFKSKHDCLGRCLNTEFKEGITPCFPYKFPGHLSQYKCANWRVQPLGWA